MLKGPVTNLVMHANGIAQLLLPQDAEMRCLHEALIRDDYERSHPGESLEDLKSRARFSKEDQGLLHDWMTLAAARARQERKCPNTAA